MNTIKFNPNYPVILGICGEAGTGKTSTGDRLAPPAMFIDANSDLIWDHLFLAMPLYELASIRRKILGDHRKDRILFETHEVLQDLFGRSPLYGLPPYEEFTQFVKDVCDIHIPQDEDVKPRDYLVKVGGLCREIDSRCFINKVHRTINSNFLKYSQQESTEDYTYVCVVSDVRQPNEAEWVANQPNGILVRLHASPSVRAERILDRDGQYMTSEQLNNSTEKIDRIDNNLINLHIDTDTVSLEDQTKMIKDFVTSSIRMEAYAN